MMENLAQPGEGGTGSAPHAHSLYYIYILARTKNCSVRSSWEGRYAPPISTLPLYVLLG